MLVKIKEEFKNNVVAFNKSAAPLFKRNDLDLLAIIALESGDKMLLQMFEELPTLDFLKKAKTDRELGQIPAELHATTEEPKIPVKKEKVR